MGVPAVPDLRRAGVLDETAGKLPDMLADDAWRFVGYLVIVAYVGIAIATVRSLVTQRPYVVVDRQGIHRGRR